MKYHFAIISDLHLGVMDIERQKEELNDIFFRDIELLDPLDAIIVTGDTYDHKIYLNDKTTDLCIWFYQTLFQIAEEKHAKVRFVYGTKSHEADQYNLINRFTNMAINVKVIKTVEEEELFPGVFVLYLPEEHIFNKTKYYQEFLYDEECKNRYDYVFGHGVIDQVMKTGPSSKEEPKRLHVPSFSVGELLHACRGEVFFGHYHIHSDVKDRLHYVGSYNRWIYGEETPKGYMTAFYDMDEGTYESEFIENVKALRLITLRYGFNHNIFKSSDSLLQELDKIERYISNDLADGVRCIFNIPPDIENPEFVIHTINERFKFRSDIKTEITNGYVDEKRKINKEELQEVVDHYRFVLDKNLEIEDKLNQFIELRKERSIGKEKVKKYLNEPLKIT